MAIINGLMFNSFSAGIVFRRPILTSKVGPLTERVNLGVTMLKELFSKNINMIKATIMTVSVPMQYWINQDYSIL